ncbi:MAG TPA: alpha/beta hydrolase [Thermoanaerobaculia bacterium]|nr:alpha/beta hydrolase [Thermoanaerobaculia bacterium]
MPETLTAADGIVLAVEDHPVASPRARVVIVHGYAEHLGRYAALVQRLVAEGFACHLFDLRGHGHSGGVAAHVARFDDYLSDLRLVIARVRDDVPLILLAHSLGGLIALRYVQTEPNAANALAVSSPFLHPGFAVPAAKRLLAQIASWCAPTLPFDTGLDAEWLSTDESVVAAYQNDPLVLRKTTPRWFTEVEQAQHALIAGASDITLPLLMLLGNEDKIADHELAAEVFTRIGSADKTLQQYAGYRHEIFNETGRAVVIDDLVKWMRGHAR